MESRICRKLAQIAEKNPDIDTVIARYDRMRACWRAHVLRGDGSRASGELIADTAAEVNALARYAAAQGVQLKEIK